MLYHYALSILALTISTYSAVHALINKKDSRAAFGWIAVCFLFPFFGPMLYFIFGINRVRTRAKKLTYSLSNPRLNQSSVPVSGAFDSSVPESLKNLHKVSSCITGLPLVAGNNIEILYSGEQTYPSMLNAIHAARKYIYICVYIFKADKIGQKFIEALIKAKNRDVKVFVLIDGIGELYSWRKARRELAKHDIQVRRFLPPKLIPFNLNINLRNHRKLLVIDDTVSFIGGMNISDEYSHGTNNEHQSLKDIHFKISGVVSSQLKNMFESDWRFTGGEILTSNSAFNSDTDGPIICRTIIDGPAENLDHLSIILLTAINSALNSVTVMTPYFLPSRELIGALLTAALRGIKVCIILPEKNNLGYMSWASRHMLWELLEREIKVYYQPEPFEHSKLFVVDNKYSLIGSANIDPRSLRLNYEVGVEVYDAEFAIKLSKYVKNVLSICRQITLEEMENRSLPLKIRDGVAWLFSPYL